MALQHGCCGSTLVAQGGLHVCIEFMCVHGLPSTGIVPDVDVRACVHALSPDGMQASDSGVLGMHVCRCLNISKYCLGGTKVSLQDHHEAAFVRRSEVSSLEVAVRVPRSGRTDCTETQWIAVVKRSRQTNARRS